MIQKHTDGRGGNATSSEKVLNGMRKRKRQDMIFAYAVLIFPVLHFIVFWLCMNVSTVFLSFRSGNMQVGEWNNFRNYTGAFRAIFGIDKNDGMIMNWRALLNTLSLIPLSMLINLPITLIFSFAIFRKIKGYTIYRIVLFLPAMISATVLCFVFKMFINGNQAVFNKLLDGAGNLRVFFSIMYPQALPLIVSMAILNVIGLWNDYMTPYLFLNSKPTVALGVYSIQTRAEQSGAMPQAFAAMTFMTVFVLAIYAGFSKTIMSSMSVGGLKG